MEISDLKQFGKDTLAQYIINNLRLLSEKELIRQLVRTEWQIKTGNSLARMAKIVEDIERTSSVQKKLKLHAKYDIAHQAYNAANEYYRSGKWRIEL